MTAISESRQTHLTTRSKFKDSAGVLCSSLCLAHCLLLPLLLPTILATGVLGTAGALLASEQTHLMLLVPVVLLALLSFPAGIKRHRRYLPSVLATAGLTSLMLALLLEEALHQLHGEAILTALGAGLLIAAHLRNRTLLNG